MLEPSSAAIIHWDNDGITTSQKIEYSLDAGATWTTVTSTLSATSNNYTWAVPNTFTSKALIKISSGSISDVSDTEFTIIGVPATLTATDDPCGVDLAWTSVTNATGYDVMLLDTINGVWNVVGNNVVGTNYVIGGLTVGRRYWFTVRARNNSQSIVGERAVAINKINNNTGITPTITVAGNVLSTQTATTYQWMLNGVIISGATSQNYTVTQGGNYSVLVTNSSGCNAVSLPVLMSFIGVDDYDKTILYTIYPNPNNGYFNIDLEGLQENSILVITNAIGEQIKNYQIKSAVFHQTIDLTKHAAGVYFVTLKNSSLIETKKIIIFK
jgi:hypothetical protein